VKSISVIVKIRNRKGKNLLRENAIDNTQSYYFPTFLSKLPNPLDGHFYSKLSEKY
jgi:hypothetical protein